MIDPIGLTDEELRKEDEHAVRVTAGALAEPAPEPTSPEWARPEGRRDSMPSDLEKAPSRTALAMMVLTTDPSQISAYDLVHLLRAADRLASIAQSVRSRIVSQISRVYGDPESAAAEIAAALQLTRAASRADVEFAEGLNRHRLVAQLLARGDVDIRRARVLLDAVQGLDQQTAERALHRVGPHAPSLTTGQLRARLSRICLELDPQSARDRYDAAIELRRVVLSANPDTTANLMGYDLPADLAAAAAKRIDWLARRAKTKDDPRTLDQVRADVFLDLLTGRCQTSSRSAPSGQVDIVADIQTLSGESETPGHIPGYGPVIAEVTRNVVDRQIGSRWEYIVTDQGQPIATGTIRRRPTVAMKRHLRARHPTCVWPGCRMPARQSDLDHRTPWSRGGPTTLRNLAPLCDFHHNLLDKGWRYEPTPEGGFRFVSPLGHTYISSGHSP
ncbi:MAG TPA: DUF222 domain-containing protein [Acidimicrobiia bacterium]